MSTRVKVTFSLTKPLIERLNQIPRADLPNKSALIEKLLEKWLEDREKKNK